MKGIRLGQSAAQSRVFTLRDVAEYAALSEVRQGTRRAVGQEDESARGEMVTGAERARVPAPLLGGMFSYLLGTRLPGRGTNYMKQRLAFITPAYTGEEITATVEVVRLRPEKELVNLRTICTNEAGEIICEGEALVLARDVKGFE